MGHFYLVLLFSAGAFEFSVIGQQIGKEKKEKKNGPTLEMVYITFPHTLLARI